MKELVNDSIVLEYVIEASPDRVFRGVTAEIGAWWTHSFKEHKTVSLEPRVGGRFYEDWGDGQGALYATVTYLEAPRKLRLSGPMGMSGAVACAMEFALEDRGASTLLKLTHDILGTINPQVVEEYRAGWKELLGQSLKNHVEQGAKK